ncbi:MAG: cobaltochelatase CobT-related protein [Blautia faecis]
MANKLLKRPEKQKLLFLISDGLPNATRYFGSYATADLKKIKEKLGKKGILFQAAAIGWDKEAIRKIYGNAILIYQARRAASHPTDKAAGKITSKSKLKGGA